MPPFCFILVFLALAISSPAQAQNLEEAQAFMNELNEIANGINEETAKEQAGKCKAMAERLNGMQGFIPAQRLYFEARIEHCLFYAMNNGKFSDKSGDQCSHHITYATKLAASIEEGLKVPGMEGEYMANFASQLESAVGMGPSMGCKGDYAAFAKTLEAATAAGQTQPKEPDFAFMEDIMAVRQAITPETAKADIEKCRALADKMADKKDLFPFEMQYYPALIESCLAIAMERGAAPDAGGDACAHHYRFGELQMLALAEGKKQPGPFDAFLEMIREEVKGLSAVGKELGCQQDFERLKEQ